MPLDVGGKDQACSQGEEGPQDGAAPSNGLELRPQAEGAGRLLRLRDLAAEQHQDWGVREPGPRSGGEGRRGLATPARGRSC